MTMARTRINALLPVLGLLLLAAAMRILGAAHAPYWSDEAWNIWATDSGIDVLLARLAANHHPPLFFLALDGWLGISGESRLAVRFISIISGILTTAVIYRIGRENFGAAVGLCAGLIFAVFEQPVYYGQSVRHYAWLLLAEALALWLFLRALRRPTWGRLAAYAVAVALVAYTVYIGLIAIFVQALVGLFVWRASLRDKARLVAAYLGAFALFAPWLAIALPGALRKVNAGAIAHYHNSLTSTLEGITRMLDILLGGQAALGLGLLALGITAVWQTRRSDRNVAAWTVLAGSVGALALMAAANLFVGIISERTLAYMTPAFALALAFGAQNLPVKARNLLVGALVLWAILTPQGILPRLNSDIAAQTVAAGYSPDDLVILETGFDDMAFAYELGLALPPESRIFPSFSEYYFPDDAAMLASLDAQIAAHDRIWLVYWNVPPRLRERLISAGFAPVSASRIPAGEGDRLYIDYPQITISRYVRVTTAAAPLDFGETLRLSDVVLPEAVASGESFSIDLRWEALAAPDRDYTAAVFIQDVEGVTRVESFGPEIPTSTWTPAAPIVDTRRITLPADLAADRYTVRVLVYWYQAVDQPLPVNDADSAVAAIFTVYNR